jgi:hypothetical protein
LPGANLFLFEMAHGLDAALIGYLASGFFVTVLYYPFFWINFAMTVALHRAALNKVRGAGVAEASALRHPRARRTWRGTPRVPARHAPAR